VGGWVCTHVGVGRGLDARLATRAVHDGPVRQGGARRHMPRCHHHTVVAQHCPLPHYRCQRRGPRDQTTRAVGRGRGRTRLLHEAAVADAGRVDACTPVHGRMSNLPRGKGGWGGRGDVAGVACTYGTLRQSGCRCPRPWARPTCTHPRVRRPAQSGSARRRHGDTRSSHRFTRTAHSSTTLSAPSTSAPPPNACSVARGWTTVRGPARRPPPRALSHTHDLVWHTQREGPSRTYPPSRAPPAQRRGRRLPSRPARALPSRMYQMCVAGAQPADGGHAAQGWGRGEWL
jgi:hypothetical protein